MSRQDYSTVGENDLGRTPQITVHLQGVYKYPGKKKKIAQKAERNEREKAQ